MCPSGGRGKCFTPFLPGPGRPRRVQSRSEGIDLDFTRVTDHTFPGGHSVQRNRGDTWIMIALEEQEVPKGSDKEEAGDL